MNLNIFNNKIRFDTLKSFGYAFSIGSGLWMLTIILEVASTAEFLFASIILYSLVLLELYMSSNHYHIQKRKNSNATYLLERDKIIQYSHHIILPSILYLSMVSFMLFTNQQNLYLLLILIGSFLFGILFDNIDAFYDHEMSHNKATFYIYDAINLFLVFLITYGVLAAQTRYSLDVSFSYLGVLFGLVVNFVFLLSRHIRTNTLIYGISVGVVIWNIVLYILLYLNVSIWVISFTASILFHFAILYTNHSVEREIKADILLDHGLEIVLVILLMSTFIQ